MCNESCGARLSSPRDQKFDIAAIVQCSPVGEARMTTTSSRNRASPNENHHNASAHPTAAVARLLPVAMVNAAQPRAEGPGQVTIDWAGQPPAKVTLTFDKPAIAVFVEVAYDTGNGVFTSTSTYDNYLREGRTTILLNAAGPKPLTSTEEMYHVTGRVRYVEYQDGSVDGDLDAAKIDEVFTKSRELVKEYARAYAQIARTSGRAGVDAQLTGDHPTTAPERDAVEQIRVNARAISDLAALIDRLEQLAR